MKLRKMNKFGQEEMIGFALILVVIAVVILVFLSSSIKNAQKQEVEDFESQSFVQSMLQYTTSCEIKSKKQSVRDLIFRCNEGAFCGEVGSCVVLEDILVEVLRGSWNACEDCPVRGYRLEVVANGELLEGFPIQELYGEEESLTQKGASQDFAKSGDEVYIYFTTYS